MNLLDIICRPNSLDPCCPGMLHPCIRINILDEPNPTHTCTRAPICPCPRNLSHACMPMPMLVRPLHDSPLCPHGVLYVKQNTKKIFFNQIILLWPIAHVMSPSSLHIHNFPLVFSTMPTFCTLNAPSFHICFVFLVSHACFGEDYLTCGPFSLDMCPSITCSHLSHTMEIMVVAMMVEMTRQGWRLGGTRLT